MRKLNLYQLTWANLGFVSLLILLSVLLLVDDYRQRQLLRSAADALLTIQEATLLQLQKQPCAEKGTDVRTY